MSKKLKDKLIELNITLNEKQEYQFHKFYELLIEWNKVMNLTGITDYDEVNEKHFVDSLSVVKAIDIKNVNMAVDIGTGAGFPGIPLKIAFPDLNITLLDSLNKRVKFLNEVTSGLELKGIEVIHGRAEDYAKQKQYREKYDLCVSRAVAHLATLSEYCLPYVKKGGYFISYKSGKIEDELNLSKEAIKILGGSVEDIIRFELPNTDITRTLVKVKKKNDTEKKYPRKAGLPAKEPIGI